MLDTERVIQAEHLRDLADQVERGECGDLIVISSKQSSEGASLGVVTTTSDKFRVIGLLQAVVSQVSK